MSASPVATASDLRAPSWSKSCGCCPRAYGSAQWQTLAVIAAISPARVQAHLSVPAAWAVELRRCACGAVLAARRLSLLANAAATET